MEDFFLVFMLTAMKILHFTLEFQVYPFEKSDSLEKLLLIWPSLLYLFIKVFNILLKLLVLLFHLLVPQLLLSDVHLQRFNPHLERLNFSYPRFQLRNLPKLLLNLLKLHGSLHLLLRQLLFLFLLLIQFILKRSGRSLDLHPLHFLLVQLLGHF